MFLRIIGEIIKAFFYIGYTGTTLPNQENSLLVQSDFITETYQTTFVSNYFHVTKFWFDTKDNPELPSMVIGIGW